MENTCRNPGKECREEENAVLYAIESIESKAENLVSEKYRRNSEPKRTLILGIRKSRTKASCREFFLHNIHVSNNSIPKQITTFAEKYVLCCLESIRNCALRSSAWNFTQKVDILSYHTSSLAKIKNRSCNSMGIEYPLGGGRTEVVTNSTGDWTIGSISGSPTMINILKSPLLQQFGSLDGNINFVKTGLLDVSESFYSNSMCPLQEPTSFLSHKLQKDVKAPDSKCLSAPLHKRDASISSSNSSFSGQSSSSMCGTSFQGMLQCTWKDGLQCLVFTVDDKKEVYAANLSEADSSDDKDLDYLYTFYSRRNGKKDTADVSALELETVAKMRVSTSITFSPDNSEVRETQFILSISSERETQTSNQAQKKHKTLTRKVVDVFRPGHSHKRRSSSLLEKSSSISIDTPLDTSKDVNNSIVDLEESCAENKYAPTLELAAIIVKDVYDNHNEVELGGWGLKFLKKTGNSASLEATIPSESSRNAGECSTSMDVLIPAGIHGGPRTKTGGPSTLIERWISGGHCDCGGWDIGCPLTFFNTRSTSTDNSGECKSIDLFMQGSKQNVPTMKMVTIHEGLYYIHFQSALSTLQSFAISAAIIHSRSPVLRSKVYRGRK